MDPVGICNLALHHIGAAPISNLETDTTKSAVACQAIYAHGRDRILTEHTWAFAANVQSLTSLTDDGLTKYDYKYALPADPYCLRVRELKDSEFSDIVYIYELMGRYIYTNLTPAYLKYTMRVEDPEEWDPLFTDALCWWLAASLIQPLGNKSGADAAGAYNAAMLLARGVDEQQKQERQVAPRSWTETRFGR